MGEKRRSTSEKAPGRNKKKPVEARGGASTGNLTQGLELAIGREGGQLKTSY